MVWECQVALQKHLALTFRCDPYLPGNAALIMLFLFSFPAIVVTKKTDGSTKTAPANSPESDNNGEEILILEVPPDIAPNPISVLLRINYTTRKASLQLYSELQNAPFDWDEWVDSAMGCMAGIDDHLNVSRSRTISRTGIDLSKSLLQLHLTFEKDGESRKVNIFERWPIFDSDVCHFEVGQWMKAHEIDVDEGSCSFYDSYFDKSVGTWTAWFSQNAELPWYSKATHLVLPGGINHLRRKRNHPDVIVQ